MKTMTMTETAKYIGCSLPTLRKMVSKGIAPPYLMIGDTKRWTAEGIDSWRRVQEGQK
jgi:excisionase family DNA binding protein